MGPEIHLRAKRNNLKCINFVEGGVVCCPVSFPICIVLHRTSRCNIPSVICTHPFFPPFCAVKLWVDGFNMMSRHQQKSEATLWVIERGPRTPPPGRTRLIQSHQLSSLYVYKITAYIHVYFWLCVMFFGF